MRTLQTGLVAGLLITSFGLRDAQAVIFRHDRMEDLYQAYAADPKFQAVGGIHVDGSLTPIGSGTLIAPQWVLTAGHVIDTATTVQFNLNPTTLVDATTWYVHPFYNPVTGFHEYDIALIRLQQPINSVTPAAIYRGTQELWRPGAIAGWGIRGEGYLGETPNYNSAGHTPPWDDPQKRAANNMIDRFKALHVGTPLMIEIDFDNPDYPAGNRIIPSVTGGGIPINGDYPANITFMGLRYPGDYAKPLDLEGNTAHGDSGGPLFITIGNTSYIAGVTHGGDDPLGLSRYDEISDFVRVSEFKTWIDGYIVPPQTINRLGVYPVPRGFTGEQPDYTIVGTYPRGASFTSLPEPSSVTMVICSLVAIAVLAGYRRWGRG